MLCMYVRMCSLLRSHLASLLIAQLVSSKCAFQYHLLLGIDISQRHFNLELFSRISCAWKPVEQLCVMVLDGDGVIHFLIAF